MYIQTGVGKRAQIPSTWDFSTKKNLTRNPKVPDPPGGLDESIGNEILKIGLVVAENMHLKLIVAHPRLPVTA